MDCLSPDDIYAAAKQLSSKIINTPTLPAPALSKLLGCELYLKHEQLQHTSSFKARGAYLAILALSDAERAQGVITMSAGNHAQAVAYHAQKLNIHATIVMPKQTPFAKIERTRAFGAEIVLEGRNLNECEKTVAQLQSRYGYSLIHPYDDAHVIRGQGTVGLEILESVPDLDCLVVPIGGGGLIGGISLIAKSIKPDIEVIGVEAELYASMHQTLTGQTPSVGGETIAEGIAVKVPGALTVPLAKAYVDDILLDDSSDSAGAKLASIDLIGLPWQVIAGPRSVEKGVVEIKNRQTGASEEVTIKKASARLLAALSD